MIVADSRGETFPAGVPFEGLSYAGVSESCLPECDSFKVLSDSPPVKVDCFGDGEADPSSAVDV